MRYHIDNDLLAVVCDDLGIRVIDLETKKIVREFWGHRNRITDFVSIFLCNVIDLALIQTITQ